MTYEMVRNEELNGLEVKFAEKPCEAVRAALKALRFRWHKVKGLWYGRASEDDVRAAIEGAENGEAPVVSGGKANKAALIAELKEAWLKAGESEWWAGWYADRVGHIAKASDGSFLVIHKPHIETSFCFGESGYDYDDAVHMSIVARTNEEWFKRENLKEFRGFISALENGTTVEGSPASVWLFHDRVETNAHFGPYYCRPDDAEEISAEDRAVLLALYKEAYAAFEKRLNAYLKRYGLSKIHSWTYWRDA